jgi:hypothetical protein
MPYDAARLDELARVFMRAAMDDLLREVGGEPLAGLEREPPAPPAAPVSPEKPT